MAKDIFSFDHLKPNTTVHGPILPEPVKLTVTIPLGNSLKLVGIKVYAFPKTALRKGIDSFSGNLEIKGFFEKNKGFKIKKVYD